MQVQQHASHLRMKQSTPKSASRWLHKRIPLHQLLHGKQQAATEWLESPRGHTAADLASCTSTAQADLVYTHDTSAKSCQCLRRLAMPATPCLGPLGTVFVQHHETPCAMEQTFALILSVRMANASEEDSTHLLPHT